MEYLIIISILSVAAAIFVAVTRKENKLPKLLAIAEQAVTAVAQMYKKPENETPEEAALRHAQMKESAIDRIQALGSEVGLTITDFVAETLLEAGVWAVNFAEKKLEEKKVQD